MTPPVAAQHHAKHCTILPVRTVQGGPVHV